MPRALVVYESMFGSAREVAEAVAAGLADSGVPAGAVEVGQADATLPADVSLLVVGGPTHATTMSRSETRSQAAGKTDRPLVSRGIGIREWIARLGAPRPGLPAVTFDTRMTHPKLITAFNRAAETSTKALAKRGFVTPLAPGQFIVSDTTGPLAPGEAERARQWGRELAELAR